MSVVWRCETRDGDIATNYHWLLHSLALNPHLPNPVRTRLADHPDPAIRAALVVGCRDAPQKMFARLIDDPDKQVRQQFTESEHVPAVKRNRFVQLTGGTRTVNRTLETKAPAAWRSV